MEKSEIIKILAFVVAGCGSLLLFIISVFCYIIKELFGRRTETRSILDKIQGEHNVYHGGHKINE